MGTKKRILSLIVVVAMLVSTAVTAVFADGNFTVTASSETAQAGETAAVTISLANNPGIIALRLQVAYNSSVLTLTGVTDAGKLGSESHTSSGGSYDLTANPYTLYWFNGEATSNYTATGTVATLTFAVANNAAEGDYNITVTVLDSYATQGSSGQTAVTCTPVNGKVTVPHIHSYGAWTSVDGTNHKKVCACGDEVTEAHTWNDGVVTTPATHTATGVKTYTCTVCGGTKTETIAKTPEHSYGEWTSVDETNHKRVCACGDEETAPHTWNDGVVTTPATHSATGVKTYTCTACGATKTETIAQIAHSYGAWTYADEDNHERECSCGAKETEGHTWNSGEVTTPATHTATGVKTYTCTVCGGTKTETIAKTPEHSYGEWTSVDETNHKRVCACGDEETAPHTWNDGVVTTPATHSATGVKTYTCTACGATKTETIAQIAHSYGAWTQVDETNHKKVCACGDEITEAHTWNEGEVTTAATHTATGVKTYTCTVCGGTKTETIAKLEGHTYGEWTSVDGTNHKKVCACGDEITEAHTWNDGVVTTAPTKTTYGVKTYTCTVCGGTKTVAIEEYLGDINGDTVQDIKDAILLFNHSMYPTTYLIGYKGEIDLNGNGVWDIGDAIKLFNFTMYPSTYPIEY